MPEPVLQPGEEHCCPRCGYELLGIRPADPDAALTCPECGLATSWRAMNDRERHARGWHLECTERGSIGAAVRTAWVTLFPGWLWTWVTLELPIRRGRLLRFGAAFLLLTHLAMAACAGVTAWVVNTWGPLTEPAPVVAAGLIRPPRTDRAPTAAELGALDLSLATALGATSEYGGMVDVSRGGFGGYFYGGDGSLGQVAAGWAARGGFTLPDGEADAWAAAVVAGAAAVQDALNGARERQRTRACARALVMPYGPIAVGTRDPTPGLLRGALTLARLGVLTAAVMPLSFLLLRQSMRMARVRPVHLLRAFAYSQPPVLVFAGFVAAMSAAASAAGLPWSTQEGMTSLALPPLLVLALAAPLWFVRMWQLFVGRYLRMAHAPWVLAAMMVLSLAAACCLCFFAWDRDGMTRLLSVGGAGRHREPAASVWWGDAGPTTPSRPGRTDGRAHPA